MKNKFSIALSLAVLMAMLVTSLALASDVAVAVVDVTVPNSSVTLVPGSTSSITIIATVTGKQDGTATFAVYRDWTLSGGVFTGSNAQTFTVSPRAAQDPDTVFTVAGTVTVTAGEGDETRILAVSAINIQNSNQTGAKLSDGADSNYQVTVDAPSTPTPTPDTTGPVISKVVSGTAGTNGWYTSDVTVTWSVSDAQSAVVIDSGCGTQNFTSETTGAVSSCSAHSAGGPSSDSVTIKIDRTGPSAALAVSAGTLGANGWYISDVTVSASGSDSISSPVTCTGDQYQTTDTTGQTFNGSCTNDAGLKTDAAPLTIKLDKTAPVNVVLTPSGTAGTNGWFIDNVTITTSGDDDISGVTCSDVQSQTAETAGSVFNGSCTNGAGQITNAAPLTIKLDKTAPSASLAVTAGTVGTNGWYTSDVTISTSGNDDVSSPVTCTTDQFQTAETIGTAFNGSCTNDAGLKTDAAPLTVKLDKTGPSAVLSATGTLGNNGWYVGNVTISTTGSDTISNPTTCTSDQAQTTDTTGAVFNGSCTNDAGLTTNAAALTIKRDATPPTLAPTVSPNPVILNAPATAAPNASDVTSGLASSGCGAVNTSAAGSFTVNCTATDNAGNSASKVASYTVAYKVCALYDQAKSHKAGSTVPLKLQLCDVNGVNYSSASIIVKATQLTKKDSTASPIVDSDSGNANPDSNFRYDATLSGYIFNFSTKGLTTGTWIVTFTVDGAGPYNVQFDVK